MDFAWIKHLEFSLSEVKFFETYDFQVPDRRQFNACQARYRKIGKKGEIFFLSSIEFRISKYLYSLGQPSKDKISSNSIFLFFFLSIEFHIRKYFGGPSTS